MSHYIAFGDSERDFIKRHTKLDLAPESCICKAHQIDAKRMWDDPQYVPKWKTLNDFSIFIEKVSSKDDTWKFWCQFIFKDCLAYIALYLAIRCKNWKLRVSALKLMAPLFAA